MHAVPDNLASCPETELVTIDEMALRLSMSRKQFVRLVRVASIPKIKIGHRTVRFAPSAVIGFLSAKFTAVP